jgi:nucleotide-binding universal stress UspA family protein
MKRKRAAPGIKKILVATDFSAHSNLAMDYAATLAKQSGAEIILIHVIESFPYSVTDTFNIVDHRRALERTAGTLLENLRQELARKDLSVETQLASGAPYDEILKRSRREKADLIVMGTHGRTGVEHLILGSVAEKVVRLSSCPVMTIPFPARGRRTMPAQAAGKPVTLY